MGKKKVFFKPKQRVSYRKEIRYEATDAKLPWVRLIPTLRDFKLEKVDFLSITGDAPKDFITDSEYRPGHRSRHQREEHYIAKVGSKWYPHRICH